MMGLMGRSSKSGKLKMVGNLAISRIAILRKHHSVRCSQARSDVIQLLQRGDQEHALLRVEYVIKEQGTLDSFDVIEYCCHLLRDRSEVIKNSRECPDELKEAISSLIFAASRCGGFPELQEIRSILFTCRFGKQLADSAAESRNDSTVYPKIIQGFSRKQTSLETRQNVLKQMAIENGICLPTVSIDHEAFNIASEEQQQQSMHDRTNEAVGES